MYNHNKVFKKNVDNIKLLLSDANFNKQVIETRIYLNIPSGGFNTDDYLFEEIYLKWQEELFYKSEKINSTEDFMVKLKETKENLDNHKINEVIYEKMIKEINAVLPTNHISKVADDIIIRFNLPVSYKSIIRNYILYNNSNNFMNIAPFIERRGTPENPKEKSITLTFYSQIDERDLRLVKETVNSSHVNLPKFGSLQNLKKDLKVEFIFNSRKYVDAVSGEEVNCSIGELMEELRAVNKDIVTDQDVYDIIHKLNKNRKKRFH